MNTIHSEILLNRSMLWLLMAMATDNTPFKVLYVILAISNMWSSYKAQNDS